MNTKLDRLGSDKILAKITGLARLLAAGLWLTLWLVNLASVNTCTPPNLNTRYVSIMASSTWALSQISKILPLDNESLQEILDYSSTLSKEVAAEHLKNLLGDSQNALDFINAFNSHREPQATTSSPPPAPVETKGKPRKKKANFNKLPPPRQPDNYGNVAGRYVKKEDDYYIAASRRPRHDDGPAASSSSSSRRINEAAARELPTSTTVNKLPKAPPSASGPLISDLPNVRTSSRTAPPTAKAKVNISGGSAMHGASTVLQDLVSLSLSICPRLD